MSNKSSGERLPSSPSHHKSAKTGGAKSSSKPSGSDQNENSSNSPSPPVVVLNEFLAETYENLFNFKNESLFTDVQIYVDGVEFPCHKVILCAASSYFRAMFTCDLKEARHGKVYIENISPWTMKRLLDFIYTGRIEISPDNVIDLFNAALLFQLHALVDKCTAYIQANIDLANCVEVNLFASMHQLASLEACSFKFMLENFMHLVHLSLSGGSSTTSSSSSSSSTSSSHHHHHHKAHHPANTPTSLMNALLNDQSASAAASKSASTAACSPPSSPYAFSSHSTSSAAANNELSLSDNLYSSFVRLSEQTFSELLKSDHLNVTREIYAYYSLVKWLDYNTELGKSTTSELHERLFANLRLNALNRDELEFIVKHDKYVRANAPLHATLKRHVYHNGQANSQPVLAQQQQPQQQQQPTVTTPQQTAQQLQQIQSQTSSLCVEDEARSNSGGVNSSGIGSSIIREVSSSAISSLARPSTIPRDYLCHLTGDRFEVYDFYKSKWSTLSPWPPSPPTTSPKKPHLNGGYSTCCLNNNLYVIGGYIRPSSSLNSSGNSTNNNDLFASASASAFDSSMSPPLEPVDWLYKYDPIANEWSLLKPMLRPRAFHLSLCLCTTSNGGTPTTTSSHKENFILLFYGITSDYTLTDNVRERSWSGSSSESTSNPSTTANATSTAATNRAWSPRLVQCLSIDLYNVQTDQWSELKISDNSLLNHHIFHLYYQYNRAQLMTLSSSNTAAAVAAASSSIPSLIALIRLQLVQSRSICALKNLIYIVNEDCIHCYQLKDDSLACLPYFRLPFNLNQFILGGAVSASLNDSTTTTTSTGTTSANEVVSLFSWFSDSDEPVGSISSSSSESPTNEFDSGAIGAAAAASASDDNATTSTAATTSTFDRRLRLKKEKEAVIYLINPTKSLVYEFYPAKNKLKKLPTLLLRHHNSEASIININSKLYVTGGYLTKNDENSHHVLAAAASSSSDNEESDESSTSSDGSAIEVYDVTSNAWSIFMSKLSTPMIGDDDEDDLFGQLPVIRKFFKLKISIA